MKPLMKNYLNLRGGDADTHPAHMKTDSAPQAVPFSGWKQNLIDEARRERSGSSDGSPGPSRYGDGLGFDEKLDRIRLNVLFTLSSEKNAGFFKTGKVFEVRRKSSVNFFCSFFSSFLIGIFNNFYIILYLFVNAKAFLTSIKNNIRFYTVILTD